MKFDSADITRTQYKNCHLKAGITDFTLYRVTKTTHENNETILYSIPSLPITNYPVEHSRVACPGGLAQYSVTHSRNEFGEKAHVASMTSTSIKRFLLREVSTYQDSISSG